MTSWKNNNLLGSKRFVEGILNSAEKSEKIVAKDMMHLRKLVKDRIAAFGPNCDLNDIDVSHITNMSDLFHGVEFNGDISQWDTSNVEDMSWMFAKSNFNGDISKWDVSNVEDMHYMFFKSEFNGDISDWDVSNVVDMHSMFYKSKFSGDISGWDVSNVEDPDAHMDDMFTGSPLEGNEPGWYRHEERVL